jgi:hypothetical protein
MRFLRWILLSTVVIGCAAESQDAAESEHTPVAVTAEALGPRYFGAHCQDVFQNHWVGDLGWGDCGNFVNEASKQATLGFYYNLQGKKYYWENGGDQAAGSLETVDLFYSDTHGGAWLADSADYAMWEDGTSSFDLRALTRNMTLGDEGRGLSIFATKSCGTLTMDGSDANYNGLYDAYERWDSVFSGGLRVALSGAGDVFYDNDSGRIFMQYMNAGYSIKDSWYYGLSYSAAATDIGVLFSGFTQPDCSNRMQGMTWNNFNAGAYNRVTGLPIQLCGWQWIDV